MNKPENVTPGMPTWYASTYYDGNSYASILVKTREGRPIFIKGNKDFGITKVELIRKLSLLFLGFMIGEVNRSNNNGMFRTYIQMLIEKLWMD